MSSWFEGTGPIACSLEQVRASVSDLGAHMVGVVTGMPGLSRVILIDQGDDFVTIETNEGVMSRTNISVRIDADRVVIELDERYQAGTMVTATSHFVDTFVLSGAGVEHRLVISGVEAPGFLGFFYRKFGSSSIGKAFLTATKAHLESRGD